MRKIVILILVLVSRILQSSELDNITWITEIYPPYNYIEKSQPKGIFIDVISSLFRRLEINKSVSDIRILPWARGYKLIQEKKNISLFSMTKTDERGRLFKWVGPVISTRIVLTAKKSRKIKVNSYADLKKYRIGTVRSDIGEQLLIQNGLNYNNFGRAVASSENISKLVRDRVDMISYDTTVTKWLLEKHGYDVSKYETVYTLLKGSSYFAFSNDVSDTTIEKIQNALIQFKKTGEFKKILEKYNYD